MTFKDYLTTEGERMLAKAASGIKVSFTKLVMGSGNLTSGINERDVKEVIEPKQIVNIGGVFLNGNDSVLIAAVFSNAEIEEGFYFREKALYMSDGTDEVLAIYGNAGDHAEYIDIPTFTVIEKRIRSILKLSQSELSNIVLSSAICAVAPIIVDEDLDTYIASSKADIIEVGQDIIAARKVYKYIGNDPHNKDCYYGCGNGNNIEYSLDDIEQAFNEVFDFYYAEFINIIEISYHETYTNEPEYIPTDSNANDTDITAEEIYLIIADGWDGTDEFYTTRTDISEYEWDIVFGASENDSGESGDTEETTDETAMTLADIQEAISTQWNGESTDDETAMSATDVQTAIDTQWNGESTDDVTALSAEDVANAIN